MKPRLSKTLALSLLAAAALLSSARADDGRRGASGAVQLGPRPFYLVEGMDQGPLKDQLMSCRNGPFRKTDFSIGHRGAALQFPEHSDVSYRAGARQGAGIVECDVTFTGDGQLVCRHSECDLHTTTDIVVTPLNAKCTVPWTGPVGPSPAPLCCTSDLTLAELKSLRAKMDASNPSATTASGYLGGTAPWRTDLYVGRAQVVSFRESIELNQRLGVKHTPELKGATFQDRVDRIFGGQAQYAQSLIDELESTGVDPRDAWVQSFNGDDILYWVKHEPRFGRQAVYLDSIDPTVSPPIPRLSADELKALRRQGVRIVGAPMWSLLSVDAGRIVPSEYARDMRRAGLDVIAWTFERSDLRQGASTGGWYYQFDPTGAVVKKDADMYLALDVLAKDVGILGIFSDWPATVTYYANCMGLK